MANIRRRDPHSGKPVVLIGAPSNGKRFWRKQSNPTQQSTRGGGGERKPPLIAHYWSSKSTAWDMHMMLDLGDPDRTAEFAPNGGSGINRELSCVLEGFGIRLTATVEEECIHDVTEEMNR